MKNLLRSDFYRARKDKVLFIGLMVTIGLVILQVLLTKGIYVLAKSEMGDGVEMMLAASGLSYWSNGVSIMGNTAQMIVPIFVTIFVVKEFNDRTIRNKLIVGYSRSQIYFSIIIVHVVVSLVYMAAAALVGLIFGTIFFGFGAAKGISVGNVIGVMLIGFVLQFILSYILLGFSIIFAINKQSLVLGILLPIVIGAIISLVSSFATGGVNETFTKVCSFFNFFQTFEVQNIVSVDEFGMNNILSSIDFNLPLNIIGRILITAPIIITAELVIGFLRFKKIQFK